MHPGLSKSELSISSISNNNRSLNMVRIVVSSKDHCLPAIGQRFAVVAFFYSILMKKLRSNCKKGDCRYMKLVVDAE